MVLLSFYKTPFQVYSFNSLFCSRVLFERVLASLERDKSWPVWSEFLRFESSVGDLASLVKVEKRRVGAFEGECKERETSLLVDRYRYLDLYPCTTQELRAMDYNVKAEASFSKTPFGGPKKTLAPTTQDATKTTGGVARPDFSHMVPFSPLPSSNMRANQLFGYPVPAAASEVLMNMPPPHCFHGPFVAVDKLIKAVTEKCPASFDAMLERMAAGENMDVDAYTEYTGLRKRPRPGEDEEEEEEEEGNRQVAPPQFDVYRMRQQRRHVQT